MARSNYQTKQKKAILDCLKASKGEHVTVQYISNYLSNTGVPVGMTTIYRCVEDFVRKGIVKKYLLDGNAGACFQYESDEELNEIKHFHFRCSSCGELFHFECKELEMLSSPIYQNDKFHIDLLQTVFQGKCSRCI